MKLLVTGATGFIGRHVIRRLGADRRFDVVAAARHRPPDLPSDMEFAAVDLLNQNAVTALLEHVRPTHLLHLAWNAEPGRFWSAPDNLDWAAATSTLVSRFAENGGGRAVIAGTCAEYDWTGPGVLSEAMETRPATFYGAAKDATRRLLCAASAPCDLSVAWGRIFWLYGQHESTGRLVSDVARAVVDGTVIDISEGFQKRDYIHVDDVAGGFVAALTSSWTGPFNVGSGRAVAVRDLVGMLADAGGRRDLLRFGARPNNPFEPPLLVADNRILLEQIGFTPKIGLQEGLSDALAWWRAAGKR